MGIQFWFSIGSTYTYPTVTRLPAIEDATGIEFEWNPFSIRAIMIEQNNIPFRDKPEKTGHMWRDILASKRPRGLDVGSQEVVHIKA